MDNEVLMELSFLEGQINQLKDNLNYISNNLLEIDNTIRLVTNLKSNPSTLFTPISQGIYLKTSPLDSKLLINVGSGIFVKKSFDDALLLLETQAKKLTQADSLLKSEIKENENRLFSLIKEVKQNS